MIFFVVLLLRMIKFLCVETTVYKPIIQKNVEGLNRLNNKLML